MIFVLVAAIGVVPRRGECMEIIVSTERALTEGTTPECLRSVAEWHDGQATQAERKNKPAKKGRATRHRRIAAALRDRASHLAAQMSQQAVP